MEPEHDRARERLALRLGPPLILEHPTPRVEAHPHAVTPRHLEAVIALRLDPGLGIARHEHARGQVPARVAREVAGDGQRLQIHVAPGEHPVAEGRVGDQDGLDVLLEPPRVLGGEGPLGDAQGERERAAAGDDVRDDRDVVPGDRVEHQDREAAPPLVFEDQRHHVVRDRDGLGDADHLVRVGAPVRGDETPEILAHPRTRPAVSSACTAARRASRAAA